MASTPDDPCPNTDPAFGPWTSDNWCYSSFGFTGFYDLTEDDPSTCHRNCSQICTTPEMLFSTWSTVAGCLNWKFSESEHDIHEISRPEFNRSHNIAIGLLNNCMEEYCDSEDPNLRGCPYRNISLPGKDAAGVSIIEPFETVSGACSNAARKVNPDLGGPGVSDFASNLQRNLQLIE